MTEPRTGNPPPQQQTPPGDTDVMRPEPQDHMAGYTGRDLLANRTALVTGGDSGIGRAVAVAFAKEGADVAVAYLSEHDDAEQTAGWVRDEGRQCLLLPGDLADAAHCRSVVDATIRHFGALDVVVNNVATQTPVEKPEDLSDEQWTRTFAVNMHSFHYVTTAALPHLRRGSAIINTASVNGLRGNKALIDYSATKGAIIAWTRSMAQALTGREIRVNCVAPGPVWTPLIPSTLSPGAVEDFGGQAPMNRAAQPDELAPSYVFLASEQMSSYYSGQVFAALGGETTPA